MMKTILVLTGGGETDETVLATAIAAATPLGAHLEFFHAQISAGEAAIYTPHVDFARGPALQHALHQLEAEALDRSAAAARRFHEFCQSQKIEVRDAPRPGSTPAVTASWRETSGDAIEHMLHRARHNDLVIVGRRQRPDGLPADLIELLLFGCGRPLLIAPPDPPKRSLATVLLCWKETAEAARALGAALPLLTAASRVIVATADEGAAGSQQDQIDLIQQLTWHGMAAEARWIPADHKPVAERLAAAAIKWQADLLVMGAYGHGRTRELIFGGCTQRFIEHADRSVLLMH